MAILTHDRPDPKYYMNMIQYDEGNWAADPIPLDDQVHHPGEPTHGSTATKGITIPGLHTRTGSEVSKVALGLVNTYAPPDKQRDSLTILSTQTSGPAWTAAKAMMDWIKAVNDYRDAEIAHVKTLNFNQIIVYQMPAGAPPWPVPPAGLTPVTPARVGTAVHALRFG